LTHIALQVKDVEASAAFYRRFCRLEEVHRRNGPIVWLAERGKETAFVLVVLPGGTPRDPGRADFSHLGFACASRAEVDEVAADARAAGTLVWQPRDEPYPVGYYCGLSDPDGNFVEFSYGQPLGPGAPS